MITRLNHLVQSYNSAHLLRLVASWTQKGSFAVLDQALFAGANFLVSILLARWMSLTEYGVFAAVYSVFLLFGTLHTAVLTEPMMIFGAGKYRRQFSEYTGWLVYGHFGLTIPISGVMLLLAFTVGRLYSLEVAGALRGLAISSPFILLIWLVRRGFYVILEPWWAAGGGALYLVLLISTMYLLHLVHGVSVVSVLLLMGISSLLSSVLLLAFLGPQLAVGNGGSIDVRQVVADHWGYGRWAIAATVLMWLPGNVYYAVLPAWLGLEGSAILKALMNLLLPILHSITALSTLLLPSLTERALNQGLSALRQDTRRAIILFLGGSLLYWFTILLLRDRMIAWVYDGKYIEQSHLLLLGGLIPFSASIVAVLTSALRALERPDKVFWAYVAAGVVTFTLGIPLSAVFGIVGAFMGLILSSATTGVALSYFFRKLVLKSQMPRTETR